jgi:hypothetical protein
MEHDAAVVSFHRPAPGGHAEALRELLWAAGRGEYCDAAKWRADVQAAAARVRADARRLFSPDGVRQRRDAAQRETVATAAAAALLVDLLAGWWR